MQGSCSAFGSPPWKGSPCPRRTQTASVSSAPCPLPKKLSHRAGGRLRAGACSHPQGQCFPSLWSWLSTEGLKWPLGALCCCAGGGLAGHCLLEGTGMLLGWPRLCPSGHRGAGRGASRPSRELWLWLPPPVPGRRQGHELSACLCLLSGHLQALLKCSVFTAWMKCYG